MNGIDDFFPLFESIKANHKHWQTQEIISCIDLTLLSTEARADEIRMLEEKANSSRVAALCIYPEHIQYLIKPNCAVATVINFPSGEIPAAQFMSQLMDLLEANNVDEIDFVFPYQTYLAGFQQKALQRSQQAIEFCHYSSISCKVILETGAFSSESLLYQLSRELIDRGCDFLKTSTGKLTPGATPQSAFILLKAIKDAGTPTGFKASGGIKTQLEAELYMNLASTILEKPVDNRWFRLGASSLLDELLHPQGKK